MEPIKFTIMIATHNNDKYIEMCLQSIEDQIYFKDNDNYQVLIGVDACEKTYNKINELKSKFRNIELYMMSENKGRYATLNGLLDKIKHDNVLVFDGDDVMLPNIVEVLATIPTEFDIVRFKFLPFRNDDIKNVGTPSIHAMGALMVRKSVFELSGGYNDNRFSSDMELIERTKKFTKTKLINTPMFYYRTHPNNLTSTVPISERMKFDHIVRTTNYTEDNVKIIRKSNTIKDE